MNEKLTEALEYAERVVRFRMHRSMRQCRKQIKEVLKERGLQDELKKFKVVSNGQFEVYMALNPRYVSKEFMDAYRPVFVDDPGLPMDLIRAGNPGATDDSTSSDSPSQE